MYGREHNKKENFSRCESTELIERVSAAIARGKRPVPFRTRKLSLSAPMVLQGGPCGRVGHRRTPIHGMATHTGWPFRVKEPHESRRNTGLVGLLPCRRPARDQLLPTPRLT